MNVTLRWSRSRCASGYAYCIALAANDDSPCDQSTGTRTSSGIATFANPPGLSDGQTYYWQVRVWNLNFNNEPAYADGAQIACGSFTTGDVPGSLNKTAPAYGGGGEASTTRS